MNLYGYVKSNPTFSYDPSGLACIDCKCTLGYGSVTRTVRVENCPRGYRACCQRACHALNRGRDPHAGGPRSGGYGVVWQFHDSHQNYRLCRGRWDEPSNPGESCPDNWESGDYLTCTSCCVKEYEFWTKGVEIGTGVGALRERKPHWKPGQKPNQTCLLRVRRRIPRSIRPTIRHTQIAGRVFFWSFIVEGVYDAGASTVCASYCATR